MNKIREDESVKMRTTEKKSALTSPSTASGTETESAKLISHAKPNTPVMILELEYTAFTRTKNNKEVDACDSIRKDPDIYRRV